MDILFHTGKTRGFFVAPSYELPSSLSRVINPALSLSQSRSYVTRIWLLLILIND